MLKEDITYTDFDGDKVTETLHFNISKTELADNLDLEDKLRFAQKIFEGEPRTLTRSEIQTILDLVKTFMRLAYGERSADGRRFAKTPEIWENFTQTAAYDAFLMSLFENPEKAIDFLVNVFPSDLVSQAKSEVEKTESNIVSTPIEIPTAPPVLESDPNPEAPLKKWSEYTTSELLLLSDAQFDQLVGKDPQKMSKPQLTVAMQRMTRR